LNSYVDRQNMLGSFSNLFHPFAISMTCRLISLGQKNEKKIIFTQPGSLTLYSSCTSSREKISAQDAVNSLGFGAALTSGRFKSCFGL
jgi:hypothetical protein